MPAKVEPQICTPRCRAVTNAPSTGVKEYEDYIEEKDEDDETNEAEVPASKGVVADTPDESDYMNMDEVDFYTIAEDVLEGRG